MNKIKTDKAPLFKVGFFVFACMMVAVQLYGLFILCVHLVSPLSAQVTDNDSANALFPNRQYTAREDQVYENMINRMRHMQEQMNRLFDDSFASFDSDPFFTGSPFNRFGSSSVDIKENADTYVVRFKLPDGETKVDVTVENGLMRISGSSEQSEEGDNGTQSMQSHRSVSSFSQSFTLPGPVQEDKLEVIHDKGELIITLPKQQG
ncbi:Hsp20/alpha crystallin family protein [bacterium]|nr:Hsp20/alpha crystallin family protein [bacterium]